ncbi:DUF2892 domain-containing protein [Gilliamella sp. BG6]|uniref:YgaP family membrane protein n=1 Tax=unclassified Gilliamella TaxID=2685620 RepID=UPI003987BC67
MSLKKNIPSFERLCRIIIGACIAYLGFLFAPTALVMWISIATGIILVCTGTIGFCPMRSIMKRKIN